MFTRSFIFFFAIASSLWVKAAGVCFCPDEWVNRASSGWSIFRPAACKDMKAAQECEKANWEISDMQSSLVSLVLLFLKDAVRTQNMNTMQAGYARSLLSLVLEDDKPEGDCANGLLADTRIQDTLAKCFSPELLAQCALVRDEVNFYQDNLTVKLESFLGNSTMTYSDNMTLFDHLIEMVRYCASIRTARIRCASFDAATIDIAQAGALGLSTSTAFFLTLLSAASFLWL